MTESNAEVQNFLAFQEGFERLFQIMREEGMADGGIIVQDCLKIVNNMLRGNPLTRKMFAQGPCMGWLPALLALRPQDVEAPGAAGGEGVGGGALAQVRRDRAGLALLALETAALLLEDGHLFAERWEAEQMRVTYGSSGDSSGGGSGTDGSGGSGDAEEEARLAGRRQQLQRAQVALCQNPDAVEGVLALALGPHTAAAALAPVRCRALEVLGLLAQGNPKVQRMFARGTVPGALRALAPASMSRGLAEDVVYLPTDRPVLSAIFEAALKAPYVPSTDAALS